MTAPDHGPNCLACTNPDEAQQQIGVERARLDAEAALAAQHRQAGEEARRVYLKPGLGDAECTAAQTRMLYHLGTANAIATGVSFHRAHLDRVEAAHPLLTAEPCEGGTRHV